MKDCLTLKIEDLSPLGPGIAKLPQGEVVFVPWTIPGDLVEVVILNHPYAQLQKILSPSPLRVQPPCKVFGSCGGCSWQHIPYELQWKTKLRRLQESMKRVHLECPPIEEFPSTQIWGYRNRIQLHVAGYQMGFFKPRSHNLVPISRCEVADEKINQKLTQLLKSSLQPTHAKCEIEVQGESVSVIWDAPHGSQGFRQVNTHQNELLKTWILHHFPCSPLLLDLYGGSGNLSLPLFQQQKAQQVYCVDVGAPSQKNAQKTLDRLRKVKQSNFHFVSKKVGIWLGINPPLPKLKACAILDPPRAGCGEDFEVLASAFEALRLEDVLHIGCDPNSFAQDLKAWKQKGYHLQKLAAFDFFPQTPHLEACALLKKDF